MQLVGFLKHALQESMSLSFLGLAVYAPCGVAANDTVAFFAVPAKTESEYSACMSSMFIVVLTEFSTIMRQPRTSICEISPYFFPRCQPGLM
ncbi:hypothetical protein DEU56DRAFT_776573 [Suillus clintonianus]|uniref:uncharacterized protein n=1 Tax=Suillus clintonianus TaxID=1904413 RepID=UPI001B87A4B7|nr:uncharacterized protein DEU56DRAFT_776573 [Suillus clintonianus]KAG2152858.1 hypothetical protein DEU56DRAFT_776573 [Suillus clintonianus]